jgi:hypothetical protein
MDLEGWPAMDSKDIDFAHDTIQLLLPPSELVTGSRIYELVGLMSIGSAEDLDTAPDLVHVRLRSELSSWSCSTSVQDEDIRRARKND